MVDDGHFEGYLSVDLENHLRGAAETPKTSLRCLACLTLAVFCFSMCFQCIVMP